MLASSGELVRKRHSELAIGLLVATLWAAGSVAIRGQDFNQARLQAGEAAYQERKFIEAIDQFRVAAFGFLDQPTRLSECLVRLALAQAAAGKTADADETLNRFLEVERRFDVYSKANLEPEIRADFQALLTRRVPTARLTAVSSLSGLVETEEQKLGRLPPTERRKALEAAAKREPASARWPLALAREATERGEFRDGERWASKALTLEAKNPQALALRVRARTARGDCTGAMSDLAALSPGEWSSTPEVFADKLVCQIESRDWSGAEQTSKLVPSGLLSRADVAKAQQRLAAERPSKTRENGTAVDLDAAPAGPPDTPQKTVKGSSSDSSARGRQVLAESRRLVADGKAGEAEKMLSEALRSDPADRGLRLALLEAACFARDYQRGATQVPLLAPFSDAEATSMLYAAVALYETGRLEEARPYMERARGRVVGQLVDEYRQKILGRP